MSPVSSSGVWVCVGAGGAWLVGIVRHESGSLDKGLDVVVSVACFGVCVFGDGFHPLH